MRFAVDPWDPSYGFANEAEDDTSAATVTVDFGTELPVEQWRPLRSTASPPSSGIAFVDGVRRVEARVWVTDEDHAAPGVCASWAAGAVCCLGTDATIHPDTIEIGRTLAAPLPAAAMEPLTTRHVVYRPVPAAGSAPEDLWLAVQQEMGRAEVRIAGAIRERAPGALIVVDGPLRGREHLAGVVGLVKTHQVRYLEGAAAAVLARLRPGERTPVFTITGSFTRHSWYVRLPGEVSPIVPLAGVIRCECPVAVSGPELTGLADALTAVLRAVAEEPLLRLEAAFDGLGGDLAHAAQLVRLAGQRGVAVDPVTRRAAQQMMNRLPLGLATNVPDRVVNCADRHHLVPLVGVTILAVEDVPDLLTRQRVLAEQPGTELLEDDERRLFEERTEQAGDPLVGPDLDVGRRQRRPRLVGRPFVPPEFGVDVELRRRALLDGRYVGRSGDLERPDGVDSHDVLPATVSRRRGSGESILRPAASPLPSRIARRRRFCQLGPPCAGSLALGSGLGGGTAPRYPDGTTLAAC